MKRSFLVGLLLAACGGTTAPAPPPKPPAPPAPALPRPDPEAWRNERPEPGAVVDHPFPEIATKKLGNGLTLYVVGRHAGVVSLSVVAKGGAGTVPAGKSGLSALTVRMMTEGTKKHGALALAEAVEAMGTTLQEDASRDSVRLAMTVLREDLERGLGLLAEVVSEPAFSPTEFSRVQKEWLDDLEGERQSPGRLSSLVGLRLLLGTTLGAPVNGSRKDVAALGTKDLVDYHRRTFVPESMALVISGDVTLDAATPIAEKLFGHLRGKAERSEKEPAPPAPEAKQVVHLLDRPGAVQSALFVAQPFPKRGEPGEETRELLNALFGGIFTSRLNMNLREEHAYTYGARSLDIATRQWGAFGLMTSVRTDVTAKALSEAMKELRAAKDPAAGRPITDAEVALARVDLTQHLGASLAHTGEVAARVEDLFTRELPVDYYRRYPTLLDASDARMVATEAQRLTPEAARIVVVGDESAIRKDLEALGFQIVTVPSELAD
ncbi:MAG TPA: pitrilysin family protein [Polyangiaceae bacterium]|nr:pitrilysin family protein [Polyangiaceae bacterium]